jgi:beta-lactamase regulating signal transducer with metallopeptidase domain
MSAILQFLNALSAAGLTAVLNTLWLALAVAAVIWFALRWMPHVNAATRHGVWWAVLALVVLVPLATLLPRPELPVTSPAGTENQVRTHALPASAVNPLLVTGAGAPGPPVTSAPLKAAYSRGAAPPRTRVPVELRPGNWPSSLLFLWAAVSSLLLGRIVHSYLHLRGLRNRARPASGELATRFAQHVRDSRTSRAPQLLVSEEVVSPLAAGFLHPVVILPDLLQKEIAGPQLDCVLLHELAHVVRRDDWTNLLGRLAFAAFFLNPVAAWVLRRIEREREIACDDWVVAATGSAARYAATLSRLFEFCCTRRRELLATGMAHRSSKIGERIETLLRPRFHLSPGASRLHVGSCAAACLALLIWGARMPGWVSFAKDSTVPVNQDAPQSQMPSAHIALAPEASPFAVPAHPARLSPAPGAQSSAPSPAILADQNKTWRHEWKLTRYGSSSGKVQFSIISRDDDGDNRMNTQDVSLSSLAGFSLSALDHDGPVKFEYVRDSGRILCEGQVTGGSASGPFTVALNPTFVSALEKMGYAAPHDDEAFSLVISDVTLDYARAIRDTGLTSSLSDLIELQDHGVSPDYVRTVRQEGFTNLSASEISELRDHGVEPNYLKAIKAAGPNLSIEQIDSLYDHGVKPDSYQGFASVDPNLSIDKIDSLYDHGVKPDYYKSMKAAAPQLSIEQIDGLYDHGVKPDSYQGFTSVDPNLSIEQIDSLYDHGVKPDYYKSMKAAAPQLSIEQIDSLYDHGVEPDSYHGFASVDSRLSIEQVDSLRDHGVEPEFYQRIKAADSTVSIEEINTLRDHGVEPEYLKEIRALPDRFSISDISELRDHGITAKYIRNLHDMGMKNVTAAQIVRLHDGN